jgi:hypothetical protein
MVSLTSKTTTMYYAPTIKVEEYCYLQLVPKNRSAIKEYYVVVSRFSIIYISSKIFEECIAQECVLLTYEA